MERSGPCSCTQGNANGHWAIGTPTPSQHGCIVEQSVVTEGCKASELNFNHGAHTGKSSPDTCVYDDGLTQRHVQQLVAVASVLQSHVHAKRSCDFHVLANEDTIVSERRSDVSHGLLNRSGIGPATLFCIGPCSLSCF